MYKTKLATVTVAIAFALIIANVGGDANINIRGWAGNREAKRLYDHLFSRYDRLIRPVTKHDEVITVKLGLKLAQLIAVDEVSQVVHFNMWVRHEWHDINLTWNASEFGGITRLYVPSEYLWIPDIVLHNNAEGEYNLTISTKATVFDNGLIIWEPPAIFKFHCAMSIEYFPYDEQSCTMKFGPWSHSGLEIDLKHVKNTTENPSINIALATDLREYVLSAEWDILDVPGYRGVKTYACCPDMPYPELFFTFVLRRKPLFYTVTLIVPCVSISFLTILAFYLPPDSRKKIELCKSILVSLTLFFLLLTELLPTTSLAMPIISKYLMFTLALVTVSFLVSITTLNRIHSKALTSTKMSPWVQKLFIHQLPRLLLMRRPLEKEAENARKEQQQSELRHSLYGVGENPRASASRYFNSRDVFQPQQQTSTGSFSTMMPLPPPSSVPMPASFSMTSHLHRAALPRPNNMALTPPIRLQYMPVAQYDATNDIAAAAAAAVVVGGDYDEAYNTNNDEVWVKRRNNISNSWRGGGSDSAEQQQQRFRYGIETLTLGDFGYEDSVAAAAAGNAVRRRRQRRTGSVLSWLEGPLSPGARALCRKIVFMAEHIRLRAIRAELKRDWKYVTVVIDRVFLLIFTIVSLVGFVLIILTAPTLYDTRQPIPRKCSLEKWLDSALIPYDCMKRPELMH